MHSQAKFRLTDRYLLNRNEFLKPRVGRTHLRDVQISLRVQGHAFDKVELAGLMPLMPDRAKFFAIVTIKNPNFSIHAISDIQKLLFGVAREHRRPDRSL